MEVLVALVEILEEVGHILLEVEAVVLQETNLDLVVMVVPAS